MKMSLKITCILLYISIVSYSQQSDIQLYSNTVNGTNAFSMVSFSDHNFSKEWSYTPKSSTVIGVPLLEGNTIYAQELESAKTKEWHIFILMGQSNMSGYGKLLPEDSVPVQNIYSIPTICENVFEWKPAAHPLHNRLGSDRFGLGLPFCQRVLEKSSGC